MARQKLNFLRGIFIFLPFFILIALPAKADSVFDQYFSGSSIYFGLTQDTITDTNKFEGELDLRFREGDFRANARLSNRRPFPYLTDQFELQKFGFNYEFADNWRIYGGDYSLVLGRGAALNAVEERGVDRDAQLRGAMIQGEISDTNITAFWGQHKSDNLGEFVTGINTFPGAPADVFYGGRVDFDFNDLDVGFSMLKADMERNSNQLSTSVTEFDAQWRIDDFTLYYETSFFDNDEQGQEDKSDGRAQLGEIIWAIPGVSIAGSYIHYKDAYFEYGTAPTLKRTEVDESNADPNDQEGYRIDSRFSPDNWNGHSVRVMYTNLSGIRDEGTGHRDIYLELASPSTGNYSYVASYERIGGRLIYYTGVPGVDENYRFSVDGPFCLGGSFHFSSRYRILENSFGDDEEVELGLDWAISPEFTIGLFRETSTRPSEPPPPGMMGIPTDSPGQWNMGFVSYNPDPWTELELVIGSRRGGYQCSGGVCANLPPFKGVLFTYYRYL